MDWGYKAVLTAMTVAAVLMMAQLFGRRLAGLVAGLPVITAPSLLWLALEQGGAYAAHCAIGSAAACGAGAIFALIYERAARRHGPLLTLTLALASGGAVALLLALLTAGSFGLPLALLSACALGTFALRALPAAPAGAQPLRPLRGQLLLTAALAGVVSGVLALAAPWLGAFWAGLLAARGVRVEPFRPANMGVTLPWSPAIPTRWAGAPLKNLRLTVGDRTARGEAVITRYGLEGGAVYALSAALREASALTLDLKPDLAEDRLAARLAAAAAGESLANRLRKAAGLTGPAAALLREAGPLPPDPAGLAARIKALTLPVAGVQGLERAISSAGGLALDELDDRLMLRRLPGVFAAGEMLDWEAPTGGYLLQACFASGTVAAGGVMAYLAEREGINR